MTGADDYGITVSSALGSGRLDATITGNTSGVSSSGFYAIHAAAGASSSMFTNKVCANVANNTAAGSGLSSHFQARAAMPSHQILLQGRRRNTFTFGATCTTPTNPIP